MIKKDNILEKTLNLLTARDRVEYWTEEAKKLELKV